MATPNHTYMSSSPSVDYLSITSYKETFEFINKQLPIEYKDMKVKVGIVCGSGLGGLSSLLKAPICELKYENIPHFGLSTVLGHEGKLVFGILSGQPTVCMVGRKHMYEGHASIKTAFPIRVMSLLGAKTLIVTNAVGGLNLEYKVGDIMVISDHISFPGIAGQNPLIGKNIIEFGDRFPAISDAYEFDLRVLAFRAANLIGIDDSVMKEGVYAYVAGPSFETRAEARFLRAAGADVVGMSTVPEVIVARHCGMKVLGFSLVTNHVAQSVGRSAKEAFKSVQSPKRATKRAKVLEVSDENVKANHTEVLEAGNKMSNYMQTLVEKVIELSFAAV